jgi:hypothetical protein
MAFILTISAMLSLFYFDSVNPVFFDPSDEENALNLIIPLTGLYFLITLIALNYVFEYVYESSLNRIRSNVLKNMIGTKGNTHLDYLSVGLTILIVLLFFANLFLPEKFWFGILVFPFAQLISTAYAEVFSNSPKLLKPTRIVFFVFFALAIILPLGNMTILKITADILTGTAISGTVILGLLAVFPKDSI